MKTLLRLTYTSRSNVRFHEAGLARKPPGRCCHFAKQTAKTLAMRDGSGRTPLPPWSLGPDAEVKGATERR